MREQDVLKLCMEGKRRKVVEMYKKQPSLQRIRPMGTKRSRE